MQWWPWSGYTKPRAATIAWSLALEVVKVLVCAMSERVDEHAVGALGLWWMGQLDAAASRERVNVMVER
jgi:hypothetical protein